MPDVPESDPGQSASDATSKHLVIFINNSVQPTADSKSNYDCHRLINLFKELNFVTREFLCIKANDEQLTKTLNEFTTLSFASRWIVFIGSAIEYGPVAEDNRVFNVRRIFNSFNNVNNVNEPKFLVIFGSPHNAPSTVQHDAIDTGGLDTFEELFLPQHYDTFETIRSLRDDMRDQLLNNLEINYFFTSVPISIYNNENKTLLDVFIENIKLSSTSHRKLSVTLEIMERESRNQLGLPNTLCPVHRVLNDFDI